MYQVRAPANFFRFLARSAAVAGTIRGLPGGGGGGGGGTDGDGEGDGESNDEGEGDGDGEGEGDGDGDGEGDGGELALETDWEITLEIAFEVAGDIDLFETKGERALETAAEILLGDTLPLETALETALEIAGEIRAEISGVTKCEIASEIPPSEIALEIDGEIVTLLPLGARLMTEVDGSIATDDIIEAAASGDML